MEHIRALEKMFESLDPEEIKFYSRQLKKMMSKFQPQAPKKENAGKAWDLDEEKELVRLKESGMSIKDIAEQLKRSGLAVMLRYEHIKK
jgi:DNA-binding NarL/FixJ family response regulator